MGAKYTVVTNLFVEMKSLGEIVRELRNKRGWSQTELANRVGVKAQNIQQLEDGSVKNPRYLINLAKAFRLSVEEIYHLAGTSAGEKSGLGLPDDTLRLARIIADCEPEKYRAIELIADAPADKVWAILVLLGASEEDIRRLPQRTTPSTPQGAIPATGERRSDRDRRASQPFFDDPEMQKKYGRPRKKTNKNKRRKDGGNSD